MSGCRDTGFRGHERPLSGWKAIGNGEHEVGSGSLVTGDRCNSIAGLVERRLSRAAVLFLKGQFLWHGVEAQPKASPAMKPMFQSAPEKKRFPLTDYFFHAGTGEWRGYSSHDDDDRSEFRHFQSLSREFMLVCARERAKEMWVFGLVVLAAAWPVVYMVVTVVKLLLTGRPLSN